MESSTTDPLNDTPTLPELSFDDLLDKSPEGKSFDLSDDAQDEYNEKKTPDDDTLNTPGPKKTRAELVKRDNVTKPPVTTTIEIRIPTTPTTPTRKPVQRSNSTTGVVTVAATSISPTILNSKNLLSKTRTSTGNPLIKIAPKSNVVGTTLITPTTGASGPKTAVKTANGQILYIQKASAGMPAVRLAPSTTSTSASTATATSNPSLTTSASAAGVASATTSGGNKTVAIQVLRSSDGSLLPLKSAAATTAKNALTLSPTIANQLAGKKIITTSGNQVLIKGPIKAAAATAPPNTTPTASTAASTTAPAKDVTKAKLQKYVPYIATTTATRKTSATITSTVAATSGKNDVPTTTAGPGKIFVQRSNGKQIVVSNQNLIKLSPKPTAAGGGGGGAAATATSGGQLQAIQIPGKPGLQYVRVLPSTKIITTASNTTSVASASSSTTASATTATSTTSNATTSNATTSNATTSNATTSNAASTNTTTTTTSAVKIVNPSTQKFTVVRSGGGTTKMVLTQSPKKDGVPVTFSPVTTKVQKTIVTVPTLRKIVDNNSQLNAVSSNCNASSSTTSSTNTKSNSGVTTVSMVRKHKISEINSQIQRMAASGQPEIKKTASGNRIVVMSRSMLRTNNNVPAGGQNKALANSGGSTQEKKLLPGEEQQSKPNVQGTQEKKLQLEPQNSKVQVTISEQSASTSSPRKLYSVLKTNNEPHPVDIKTSAELKSLIICGQAQALMAQQQQHKTQMLQKQNNLLQQQQQQQKHQLQLLQQQKRQQQMQQQQQQHKSNSQQNNKFLSVKIKQEPPEGLDIKPTLEETVGAVRRKHCNCTKSQCLKLYCDCFANGEFCQDCNCKDCFNNLQYEDERQKAIRNCLERNPSAFKPKITTAQDQSDMRLHNKGCNCKRSGCLKNYCECYEAKIPCSSNCKCFGCRNIEDRPDLDMDPIDSKMLSTLVSSSGGTMLAGQKRTYDKMDKNSKMHKDIMAKTTSNNNSEQMITGSTAAPEKQQCNFITQEVIDATIQCMISQADECEKNGLPAFQTEKLVMEELGRCLVEIIDFSIRNTDTSYTQE